MKSESFSIARVNRLREAASEARRVPDEDRALERTSRRWFISAYDATALLEVSDTLWLKPGFSLHAYRLYSGGDGNGVIWAVPSGAPRVPPREYDWSKPRPPQSIPFMQAVAGDGSPWSYVSASILRREAAEFGASWHGCVWSSQTIIGKAPRERDSDVANADDEWDKNHDVPVGKWTWRERVPRTWKPTFIDRGETKAVVMYIHDSFGERRIDRLTDVYPAGSYECTTKITRVCDGEGGFIY